MVEYFYDSWGKPLNCTGTLATSLGKLNPFRYRGYVYDEETGFYYLKSRYYDPETCRFISADVLLSTGQGVLGHNCYAYCRNNPISRRDISGRLDFDDNDDNPLNDHCDDYGPVGGGNNGDYYGSVYHGSSGSYGEIPTVTLGGGYLPEGCGVDKTYSAYTFRSRLQEYTGQNGEGYDAHHIFPQKFRNDFELLYEIDVDQYGAWWESYDHKAKAYEYNQKWFTYLNEKPTRGQVFEFANDLAKIYGYFIKLINDK